MKNKNSWDLKKVESLFTKQERIRAYDKYRKLHPNEDPNTFLCACGKRHSWSQIGTSH